jgi:hypothetical protein
LAAAAATRGCGGRNQRERPEDPLVTVVSSGDDEPFAHARPDALGALGKWGRGPPSADLQHRAREVGQGGRQAGPGAARGARGLEASLDAAATEEARDAILELIGGHASAIERAIAVYGLINLRTDGPSS